MYVLCLRSNMVSRIEGLVSSYLCKCFITISFDTVHNTISVCMVLPIYFCVVVNKYVNNKLKFVIVLFDLHLCMISFGILTIKHKE